MNTKLQRAATTGRMAALAAVVSGALLLTGCGSNSDTSSNSKVTDASKACVAKADAYLKPWRTFATTLPASPPARYTTLPKAPPTGKRIVYIRQNFPAGQQTFNGVSDAAKALGWKAESVIFDNTIPDFLSKFDTAIASKPDFISSSGIPAAAMQKQIDAAKAAGISVILTSTPDKPVSVPGLAGSGGTSKTNALIAQINANMALSKSNCNPNTVIFTLDYPVLDAAVDAYTKVVKDNCPTCKVQKVLIQAKDIGTPAATQQMVAKLQADPSIKYAYTMIGDLAGGLAQSLKVAGINDVNIFGQVPNETSIADLRAGTNAWWVDQAAYINGLDTMDMAARIAETGQTQGDPGGYPLALLTKDNVPAGTGVPVIPANVLDLFKAAWDVS